MDFPNSWATPKVSHTEQDWWVSAFYGFAEVKDPAAVKEHMDALLDGQRVYGSILVASEGANGTICAPTQALLANATAMEIYIFGILIIIITEVITTRMVILESTPPPMATQLFPPLNIIWPNSFLAATSSMSCITVRPNASATIRRSDSQTDL